MSPMLILLRRFYFEMVLVWSGGMPNKEIIALEKELERLRLLPPGSELVSVLNKLANAFTYPDSHKAEACALEAQDLAIGSSVFEEISKRIINIRSE